MSKVIDKTYSKFAKLIEDAEFKIMGVVEDDSKNKEALMTAMKLIKLNKAKELSSESINYLTDLIYSESNKAYFKKSVDSIELISDVLMRDYNSYNQVLRIINGGTES